MCEFNYHAFIFSIRPPRWQSETGNMHRFIQRTQWVHTDPFCICSEYSQLNSANSMNMHSANLSAYLLNSRKGHSFIPRTAQAHGVFLIHTIHSAYLEIVLFPNKSDTNFFSSLESLKRTILQNNMNVFNWILGKQGLDPRQTRNKYLISSFPQKNASAYILRIHWKSLKFQYFGKIYLTFKTNLCRRHLLLIKKTEIRNLIQVLIIYKSNIVEL